MQGDNIPLLMLAKVPRKPEQAVHGGFTALLHQYASPIRVQPGPIVRSKMSTIWQTVVCIGPLLVQKDELVISVTQIELGRVWILHGIAVIAFS